MPVYSAIHGASLLDAKKICDEGFKIPAHPLGYSMYGNGVYFCSDCKRGKKFAVWWARKKNTEEESICVIAVAINYEDENTYTFEYDRFQKYMLEIDEESSDKLDDEGKNILRALHLREEIGLTGRDIKIVFTEYLFFGKVIKGCMVIDTEILPPASTFEIREVEKWGIMN